MSVLAKIRHRLGRGRQDLLDMSPQCRSQAYRAGLNDAVRRIEAAMDAADVAFARGDSADVWRLTQAEEDRQRGRFEAWVLRKLNPGKDLSRDADGLYVDRVTRISWRAWIGRHSDAGSDGE